MFTRARRHKTKMPGVYFVEGEDGTRTYLATWTEARPLNPANPLTMKRKRVEKEAGTFDEACRLKAEADAARGRPDGSHGAAQEVADRIMASKWFEYWVRR